MVLTIVAQRHLWLMLSGVANKDQAVYLDKPVMAAGLLGLSLDVIQAKFELRKNQAEVLCCVIPRCETEDQHTEAGCSTASTEESGAAWEPENPVSAALEPRPTTRH